MTEPSADGWHFIGKHSVRFEAPDIIFNRPDGDMSIDEMRRILELVNSFPKPEKGYFGLIDASKGGRSDPAAMKDPALRAMNENHRGVVYFNAAFFHRTMIGIFQRAARLLKLGHNNTPLEIFETEAEARAWIEARRNAP